MRCINLPCKNQRMDGEVVCEDCMREFANVKRALERTTIVTEVAYYQLPEDVVVEPFIDRIKPKSQKPQQGLANKRKNVKKSPKKSER